MKQPRNTVAKAEILRLISLSEIALSHSELQHILDGLCDRVTTYRILDRLVSEGLIHKIANIDGIVKYAACHDCSATKHHHDHLHFSCEQCHTITCLEDIEPTYKVPEKYKVKEVNFTVSGICPQCS
ncbi:Fur family transcriptional regulator [Sphingobacterium sp. ML3W]|uniref:Fur family transcriptional regulator n=1 Tax=Sphingobacterium sp. ML3W TaxID=1538644 RepID=UPI0004F7422F|nr:transcriptional repressor [Sphingobacterium sp. ML3W]AIM38380.1 Fur family transcriptional regulator [Sphingobacterium sp. ML3W]